MAENMRRRFSKSKTTTNFDVSPNSGVGKGMDEIDEALRFVEDNSLSEVMIELSDKAPLVHLQEICSGISADLDTLSPGSGCEVICENCNTVVYREGTLVGVCKCKRKSSSSSCRFRIIPIPSPPKDLPASPQTEPSQTLSQPSQVPTIQRDESSSMCSGTTVIRRPTITIDSELAAESVSKKEFDPLEDLSNSCDVAQQVQRRTVFQPITDPHQATYMDVAVIRCLLIKHWSEDGVYWAMKYLLNRLAEIEAYRNSQEGMFRSRANSAPTVPHLKLFPSETDSRINLMDIQFRTPTWDDLQLSQVSKKLENQQQDEPSTTNTLTAATSVLTHPKTKVSISEKEPNCRKRSSFLRRRSSTSEPFGRTLNVLEERRRNSFTTTGSTIRCRDRKHRLDRNRSDPSLSNSSEMLSTRGTRNGSLAASQGISTSQELAKQFFPEALGSSNFIEKNGHISFMVVLKAVNLVVERCSAIRICEMALNVCETLLAMPAIEHQQFFEEMIKTILR
ncbi:unnamed protein product [Anisakis simplex]|uniref:C-CAP/cofactor C-like domain-containing protein n=1 Tax=Anisakis simplex TaxID=6269 RepID=A0A0M3KAB3_ANISI|nr:unnamed protein product [Anisakis simplex]